MWDNKLSTTVNVYSLKVECKLQALGYEPIQIKQNPENKKYVYWVHNNTDKFRADFDNILKSMNCVSNKPIISNEKFEKYDDSRFVNIYSKRVENYLREKGFEPFAVKQNKFHPEFDVWVHSNSQELWDALHEVSSSSDQHKLTDGFNETDPVINIYNIKIEMGLKDLGYTPMITLPNPKKSNHYFWVHENTPEFRKDLSIVIKSIRS